MQVHKSVQQGNKLYMDCSNNWYFFFTQHETKQPPQYSVTIRCHHGHILRGVAVRNWDRISGALRIRCLSQLRKLNSDILYWTGYYELSKRFPVLGA